jgi:transposase
MSDGFLTPRQRQRLQQQLSEARTAPLYRRTLAILQADAGTPVAHIADSLGVTRQSVYNWLDAYLGRLDPSALADAARTGRPPVWTTDLRRLLRQALRQRPGDWGYPALNWTVPLLQDLLAEHGGAAVSEASLRRQLHAWRYTWKRFRYVLDPDPELAKKNGASCGG